MGTIIQAICDDGDHLFVARKSVCQCGTLRVQTCPSGCDCRVGTDDADASECGCGGRCQYGWDALWPCCLHCDGGRGSECRPRDRHDWPCKGGCADRDDYGTTCGEPPPEVRAALADVARAVLACPEHLRDGLTPERIEALKAVPPEEWERQAKERDAVARFEALTPDERVEKIVRSPSLFDALHRYREKQHPGSTTLRGERTFLLACLLCDPPLPMPFDSPEARGKWAAAHRDGAGHDTWRVWEEPSPNGAYRTPAEWCALFGTQVMDPDGWRRHSPYGEKDYTEPIPEQEFRLRWAMSTVLGAALPSGDKPSP